MFQEKILTREREGLYEIQEYLNISHMFCFVVLMLALILNNNTIEIYPATRIRLVLYVSLVGLGAVFLYKYKDYYCKKTPDAVSRLNLYYVIFNFIFSLAINIYLSPEYSGIIFILPVLVAASIYGEKVGLAMATVCTLALILQKLFIEFKPVIPAIESSLIVLSIMYLTGWYIGVLVKTEAQHRFQLKENLLALQKEIQKREQMEKEVLRLDRLNLVGEIAAGIGHEIRNPMTTVRGFLQLFMEKKEYVQHKEHLNLMISELDRANSIITEFLSVAKNKTAEKKQANLNDLIEAILPLLEADCIRHDITLTVDLGLIPDLFLDEKEMRQIVLNLTRNGVEAMSPGGHLEIRTFTEGKMVILAVRDQGDGIKPEILDKIGTPFFTTKDQGTGLGLAVCYSIAARHNAKIDVETGPEGTTFSVKFAVMT